MHPTTNYWSPKRPQSVFSLTLEMNQRRWEKIRGRMREIENIKWICEKEKKKKNTTEKRLKGTTSQCYIVSVCLCHHDRPATVGEPRTASSTVLHTGASHDDRQSQGLSCPPQITACRPASLLVFLTTYMHNQNMLMLGKCSCDGLCESLGKMNKL